MRRELTQGQQGIGCHGNGNTGQAFDQVGNGRQVLPPRHAQRDPADVRGQQLGVLKRDRLAGETRYVVEHHQLRFVLVGPQLRIGFVRALQHLVVVGFGLGNDFSKGRFCGLASAAECDEAALRGGSAMRAEFVPAERVFQDPLRTFAYSTDASFYRLVPKAVIKVRCSLVVLCGSKGQEEPFQ